MNRKNDSTQQLTNAFELLEMLEHIFDSRGEGTAQGTSFPWNGVKLTLNLVKEQISSAKSETSAEKTPAPAVQTANQPGEQTNREGAPAGRNPAPKSLGELPATPAQNVPAPQNLQRRGDIPPQPERRQNSAQNQPVPPVNNLNLRPPAVQQGGNQPRPQPAGSAGPGSANSGPVGSALAARIHRVPIIGDERRNSSDNQAAGSVRPGPIQNRPGHNPNQRNGIQSANGSSGNAPAERAKLGRIRELEEPAEENNADFERQESDLNRQPARQESGSPSRKSLVANQKSV